MNQCASTQVPEDAVLKWYGDYGMREKYGPNIQFSKLTHLNKEEPDDLRWFESADYIATL